MIDAIYLAQLDATTKVVVEKESTQLQQSGLIHSKAAGRFEIVKELPKEADSFDGMFDYADVYGNIRLAHINSAYKQSSAPEEVKKNGNAIGGNLGIKTAELNGFSLNISMNISQALSFVNPDKKDLKEDFFTTDKDSFVYISESSLDYDSDTFRAKLGRVKVETPYANSDDIRMAANTFEGAWSEIQYTPELKSQLMYLNRWAGFDSQDEAAGLSQNEFKNLVDEESFGMISGSLSYEYAPNSELSVWVNYIDNMASILYTEIAGVYLIAGDDFHLDYALQYSSINELNHSNVDGDMYGVMSVLHYNGAFIGGAYNIAFSEKNKYVTDGFGGGPNYTSLDEATLSAFSEVCATLSLQNNDVESYKIGVGYEFSNSTFDGLVLEAVYGQFYNDSDVIVEKDAILTYEITDRWYLEAIYANYKSSPDDDNFDRALVRLDYNF